MNHRSRHSCSCLCLLALLFCLFTPINVQAQDPAMEETLVPSTWALVAGLGSLTSVTAERGAYVAASFQGEYLFHSLPIYVLTRLSFGDSITGNDTWRFDHYHQQLELGLGVRKSLGRGAFFGQITGGALGVYEVASHHQIVRVGDALGRFTNWSAGPMMASEVGLELHLAAGFSSRMAVGPTWTLQKIIDAESSIFGATAHLGLRYDF
jgi:hypothetical protein